MLRGEHHQGLIQGAAGGWSAVSFVILKLPDGVSVETWELRVATVLCVAVMRPSKPPQSCSGGGIPILPYRLLPAIFTACLGSA